MRLLNLPPDEVMKLIEKYEEFCLNLKRESMRFAWYMRGGVSYEDVLNMSSKERELLSKIIEDNIETTKKTQLPFF